MVVKAKIYIWLKLLFDQKHVMRYLFKIVVQIVVTPKMIKNDIITYNTKHRIHIIELTGIIKTSIIVPSNLM
jgi:hypothetical protein